MNTTLHNPYERIVRPELLDTLPPQDSQALRSRGDLHAQSRHHGRRVAK
jgi:hypothetical protein